MQSALDAFLCLAKERRSVRTFTGDAVSVAELRPCVEAFRFAPSAGNRQPWRVVIVTDEERIRRIGEQASAQPEVFAGAGAVLVPYANPPESWEHVSGGIGGVPWQFVYLNDLGAAIQNLLLAIHAAGLGAVWIGYFDAIRLSEIIKKPRELEPVALIPLGHVDKSRRHGCSSRRPLAEICFIEDFDHPLELS
jgi:nitroreductase